MQVEDSDFSLVLQFRFAATARKMQRNPQTGKRTACRAIFRYDSLPDLGYALRLLKFLKCRLAADSKQIKARMAAVITAII